MSEGKSTPLEELLIFVSVVGVLAAIAIPNYLSMRDSARESDVKKNAIDCQLYVESETLTKGIYPASDKVVEILNQNHKNPFGGDAFSREESITAIHPGVVYYGAWDSGRTYLIFACGKKGKVLCSFMGSPLSE